MTTEEIVSRILHRDASVLVIDKPAGLPVHPGHGGGETLSDHLDALRFGLPRRPEIAHRLDRDTSGCLVLGRHPRAIARLNELFRGSEVEKVYWAVVEGSPEADEGEVSLRIGPRPGQRWRMRVDPRGQEAVTRWRVLGRGRFPSPQGEGERLLTLLELRPVTGRTHQLRVHCAAMNLPILGDPVYGRAPRQGGPGLHLHARRVVLPYDPKKPPIAADAPVPEHMRAAVDACGG